MFKSFLRVFVARLMITFSVMLCSGPVRLGGMFMMLGRFVVRVFRHGKTSNVSLVHNINGYKGRSARESGLNPVSEHGVSTPLAVAGRLPNTSIASNVGVQFDPKDIDYLEVQRGSYSAEYGDRTYGVFNVVPRTGFERNNEAELVATYGSFHQTNDHFTFGSHTERFAYYVGLNGNRSDLGLATPTSAVIHDRGDGFGGFASLIYNRSAKDQFRLIAAVRRMTTRFRMVRTIKRAASGIAIRRETHWSTFPGSMLLDRVCYSQFRRSITSIGQTTLEAPTIPA